MRSAILPALLWSVACGNPEVPPEIEDPVPTTPDPVDQANRPPAFSGDVDLVVRENTEVAFSVDVEDPDGDTVDLSLTTQDDGAQFSLDAGTRTITARGTFDFERPVDVDRDNVYEVLVVASDGEETTEQRYTVRIEDDEQSFDDIGATVLIGEGGRRELWAQPHLR